MKSLQHYLDNREIAIPIGDLRRGMSSDDINENAIAAEMFYESSKRFERKMPTDERAEFLVDHYLRCMVEDLEPTDVLSSQFEAAYSLVALLKHWASYPKECLEYSQYLVNRVTKTYLDGDYRLQNAIETGFLEHALENEASANLCLFWKEDKRLHEAYMESKKWAVAQGATFFKE